MFGAGQGKQWFGLEAGSILNSGFQFQSGKLGAVAHQALTPAALSHISFVHLPLAYNPILNKVISLYHIKSYHIFILICLKPPRTETITSSPTSPMTSVGAGALFVEVSIPAFPSMILDNNWSWKWYWHDMTRWHMNHESFRLLMLTVAWAVSNETLPSEAIWYDMMTFGTSFGSQETTHCLNLYDTMIWTAVVDV